MYKYMPINYIGQKLKTKREAENLLECNQHISYFCKIFYMHVEMTHTSA